MPYRKLQFAPDHIYHIFNRSIAREPIFLTTQYYQRALDVASYYSYLNPPIRFSHFNRLPHTQKEKIIRNLADGQKQVEVLAFCFMPNHFHFLVKEVCENGIRKFMGNLQNSYAKYFNTKTKRFGSLFQSMFKAVRVETDEQLTHITRYIHLNPLTSFILKDLPEFENYPWSSYPLYLNVNNGLPDFINTQFVLDLFPSIDDFVNFTEDQVDYQRKLAKIKHLLLE